MELERVRMQTDNPFTEDFNGAVCSKTVLKYMTLILNHTRHEIEKWRCDKNFHLLTSGRREQCYSPENLKLLSNRD